MQLCALRRLLFSLCNCLLRHLTMHDIQDIFISPLITVYFALLTAITLPLPLNILFSPLLPPLHLGITISFESCKLIPQPLGLSCSLKKFIPRHETNCICRNALRVKYRSEPVYSWLIPSQIATCNSHKSSGCNIYDQQRDRK